MCIASVTLGGMHTVLWNCKYIIDANIVFLNITRNKNHSAKCGKDLHSRRFTCSLEPTQLWLYQWAQSYCWVANIRGKVSSYSSKCWKRLSRTTNVNNLAVIHHSCQYIQLLSSAVFFSSFTWRYPVGKYFIGMKYSTDRSNKIHIRYTTFRNNNYFLDTALPAPL